MIEYLPNSSIMEIEMLEKNLPPYLTNDLEAWKKGVEGKSRFLDCLCGGVV